LQESFSNGVHDKTTSIWSFVTKFKRMYVSPLVEATKEMSYLVKRELMPDCSLPTLKFWKEFFLFKIQNYAVDNRLNMEFDLRTYDLIFLFNNSRDIYNDALQTQITRNTELQKENEVLHQNMHEMKVYIEKLEAKLYRKKSHSKEAEDFQVVDEL
jgi:hypothetical protein